MKYPTIEEVEAADRYELCRWARFLPSPGMSALEADPEDFQMLCDKEERINKRISERLKKMGGFTPEISKSLGWRK